MELTYKISENGEVRYLFSGTGGDMLTAAIALIGLQYGRALNEYGAKAAAAYRQALMEELRDPSCGAWGGTALTAPEPPIQ